MTEKKKSRNFIATDEEWEMIKAAAGERHQSSSEFLISLALREAAGEQKYTEAAIMNTARQVYIIAASVVAKADKEWVEKTVQEAIEAYPIFVDEEDRGEGDE